MDKRFFCYISWACWLGLEKIDRGGMSYTPLAKTSLTVTTSAYFAIASGAKNLVDLDRLNKAT